LRWLSKDLYINQKGWRDEVGCTSDS